MLACFEPLLLCQHYEVLISKCNMRSLLSVNMCLELCYILSCTSTSIFQKLIFFHYCFNIYNCVLRFFVDIQIHTVNIIKEHSVTSIIGQILFNLYIALLKKIVLY